MKKVISIFTALFIFVGIFGAANAYIERENAVVTVLDKAAGKTYQMTIPVGRETKYEKMDIMVRTCKQTDPFMAENAYMFIEISTAQDGQIFGGWMNKNAPGDNPLQNADYDLWLVRCE